MDLGAAAKGIEHEPSDSPRGVADRGARAAVSASPDWGEIAAYAGLLAAFLALGSFLAVRAFRAYQGSV